MPNILHLANFKTTDAAGVYRAITSRGGLASWWTTSVEARPKVGSVAIFRFTPDYHKGMKILTLKENRRVEWECVEGDSQWIGTHIVFNIEPVEGSINLRFSHTGWADTTDLYAHCNYHWGLYIKSLKTYIETGKGMPHRPGV